MKNIDLKNETPALGNVLLSTVASGGNNTTNARCLNGHTWTYGGSIQYNLENHPCDCGAVLYHSELCKCCGQNVLKPIDSNLR